MHSDQKYIEALRSHDSIIIEEIYRSFASRIKRTLEIMGASADESGDIFQESLVDIYKMASDGKFELTCPFDAFLLMVCKRKWLNQAKKNQRNRVTNSIDSGYKDVADDAFEDAEAHAIKMERENLVMAMLDKISERCREIIKASYSENSQEKLAARLGVSYGYLRKKKSVCMAELIKLIKNKLP